MCTVQEIKDAINIFDDIPLGVIITNPEGVIEHVNKSYYDITGYTLSDLRGKKIGKESNILYSGYHKDEEYKDFWDVIKRGEVYKGVFYNKHKSGKYYWQNVSISPHRDKNGDIKNFVGYVHDVTELVEKRNFLNRVLGSVPGIVYVYDLENGENVYQSPNTLHILGYTPKEFRDTDDIVKKHIHEEDIKEYMELNEKIKHFKNGETLDLTFRMKHKDGHIIYVRAREGVFLRNSDGKVIQKIGAAIDITKEAHLSMQFNTLAEVFNELNAKQDEIASILKK